MIFDLTDVNLIVVCIAVQLPFQRAEQLIKELVVDEFAHLNISNKSKYILKTERTLNEALPGIRGSGCPLACSSSPSFQIGIKLEN